MKALKELDDPNSEMSKHMREYMQKEARKREARNIKRDELYRYSLTFEDLDDLMNEINLKFKKQYQEALDNNTYIETIDEQWLMVEVACEYGRPLTNQEKIDYEETDAVYFRGWVFGIVHGQGSYPWYSKVA